MNCCTTDQLCLYSASVPDTFNPEKRVQFLSVQPTYCKNLACQTQRYTNQLKASKRKGIPRYCRPTCIAPGYPWIPGGDSIPRTPLWSSAIEMHPSYAAGIHLSNGESWPCNLYNPPRGMWLA